MVAALVVLLASPPLAPPRAKCLLEAYPAHLCGATAEHLVWCDGTKMPWRKRVGPKRKGDAWLDAADLTDQLAQVYPRGVAYLRGKPTPPAVDFDPGRARYEPFFGKMYGATKREVGGRLAEVRWLPASANRVLQVSTVNGVHEKLAAVSADLEKLPDALQQFAVKPAGTFTWRTVKGTNRRSMHSFAVAIDIGVAYADYWRWVRPDGDGKYPWRNRFPAEVVEVFERHGFIWGGKWYHFDTMHFEYRPELLVAPCAKG